MTYAVWIPLLVPLLLPAVASASRWEVLADGMSPRRAVRLFTMAAVVLGGATVAALALLVGGALVQLPAVAVLGDYTPAAVREGALADRPMIGVLAAVALTAALVSLARTGWLLWRDLVDARRLGPVSPGGTELAVVVDESAIAYALPGRPSRVVVSTAMLRALDVDEREVLFAHERAHLAGGHHFFLAAVELAVAVNPALRPLRTVVAYGVERWADETAAEAVADRRLAARALARAALAAHTGPRRSRLALSVVGGPMPRRVAALLAPIPQRRHPKARVAAILLAACVTITSLGVADAAHDLHGNVETARDTAASSSGSR
ncbi:M48 family metalloprotease [Embleya sp. NPDC056575]|uniref:M56 family metallopeptidase n=1 Tax=unclassified Embleya TaxID=2699296 RepID=UPI0036A43751